MNCRILTICLDSVHGRLLFGNNANHRCSNMVGISLHSTACRGHLFCPPDPYGCSCGAGFKGLDCMQGRADMGTFTQH